MNPPPGAARRRARPRPTRRSASSTRARGARRRPRATRSGPRASCATIPGRSSPRIARSWTRGARDRDRRELPGAGRLCWHEACGLARAGVLVSRERRRRTALRWPAVRSTPATTRSPPRWHERRVGASDRRARARLLRRSNPAAARGEAWRWGSPSRRSTARPASPAAMDRAAPAASAVRQSRSRRSSRSAAGLVIGVNYLAPTWPSAGWLITLALTSQVLGWLPISVSLPRLPAVMYSIILTIQPIGSVALGAILLGQDPSLLQVGGVAFILVGVVSVAIPRRAPAPALAEGRPSSSTAASRPRSRSWARTSTTRFGRRGSCATTRSSCSPRTARSSPRARRS